MTDKITLSREIAESIGAAMEDDQAARLPFDAPLFWFFNGKGGTSKDPRVQQELENRQAVHFGGWMVRQSDMIEAMENNGLSFPAGKTWVKHDGYQFQSNSLEDVYHCRNILVAPIARRSRWVSSGDDDRTFSAHFDRDKGHTKSHVQMLCLLFEKTKDGLRLWHPVVLTVKGMQSKKLNDALRTWDTVNKKMREQIAPDVPPYFFVTPLGTFGDFHDEQASPGYPSRITPIQTFTGNITEDALRRSFVGEVAAALMGEYLAKAQDWLGAWEDGGDDTPAALPETGGHNYNQLHQAAFGKTEAQGRSHYDEAPF